MTPYSVYAALHDESDKGWVWSKRGDILTRTIVLLKNTRARRSVYCEYREMDHNFVNRYNEAHKSFDPKYSLPTNPKQWENLLVISGWYRDALGRIKSQTTVDLEIVKPSFSSWAALRAACQHPDPGVRVATRLAVIGTWLGLVGLLFAVLATLHLSVTEGVAISAVLLVLASIICRGANRRA
jgi:hypothetical protein